MSKFIAEELGQVGRYTVPPGPENHGILYPLILIGATLVGTKLPTTPV
jgi:hypothetical protein